MCRISRLFIWLRQVTKKLKIKIVSAGFDPISKIEDIPNNLNNDIN